MEHRRRIAPPGSPMDILSYGTPASTDNLLPTTRITGTMRETNHELHEFKP